MALYLWDVIHLVGVHLDEPGYPRFLTSASVQNLNNEVLKMTNNLKLLLKWTKILQKIRFLFFKCHSCWTLWRFVIKWVNYFSDNLNDFAQVFVIKNILSLHGGLRQKREFTQTTFTLFYKSSSIWINATSDQCSSNRRRPAQRQRHQTQVIRETWYWKVESSQIRIISKNFR